MIHIAVCDDEFFYFKMIESFCEDELKAQYTLHYFSSGSTFLEQAYRFDLVLLDIEMPDMSGIEVKDQISGKNPNCGIIFLTSHEERMQEAFGYQVLDFLYKPLELDKFEKAFWSAWERLFTRKRVCICSEKFSGGSPRYVYIGDIIRIEASGHYSDVVTRDETLFADKELKEWQNELDERVFFRVSRSLMINFYHVKGVNDKILFSNGEQIMVPRRKRAYLRVAFSEYKRDFSR